MRGRPNISFDASADQGAVRLRVSGELDIATGMALEAVVRDFRDDRAHVRLDLSGIEFMDAAGLRALVRVASGAAGWLEILPQVQPQVWRLLDLTDSQQVLNPT